MIQIWLKKNIKGDPYIWTILFMLSLCSIAVVYSATETLAYRRMEGNTEYFLVKHSILMIAAFFAMWFTHKLDYRYYLKLSRWALLASGPLLVLTYAFGRRINDASRWLTIPVINQAFQPSDLAKLALIATIAGILSRRQSDIADIRKTLVPILCWSFGICLLIALSNFSTAGMLFMTCMLLMFIGRVPTKYLVCLVLAGALAGAIAFNYGQRGGTLKHRVMTFLSSDELPFQTEQSYIAIASGGIFGKGPGNSNQKDILPHPDSDFVYAIIIEEYGMLGGCIVLMLYLALLYRGLVAVSKSVNAFGGLLSAGLSFSLAVQALFNMGVAVGLVPVTGQPLPLLSMGGTSLIFTGMSFGIILSVSRGETDARLGQSSERRNAVRNRQAA
ncbi:MAG: FtsW/RodA/SpoVE family cell cycle protein [Bacteroidota bacterium]